MNEPVPHALTWRSIHKEQARRVAKPTREQAEKLWEQLHDQLALFNMTPGRFRKWAGISERTYYHWQKKPAFPRLLQIIVEYGVIERLHNERLRGLPTPPVRTEDRGPN
jgi:hypothetical protein